MAEGEGAGEQEYKVLPGYYGPIQIRILWSDSNPDIMVRYKSEYYVPIQIRILGSDPNPDIMV